MSAADDAAVGASIRAFDQEPERQQERLGSSHVERARGARTLHVESAVGRRTSLHRESQTTQTASEDLRHGREPHEHGFVAAAAEMQGLHISDSSSVERGISNGKSLKKKLPARFLFVLLYHF